MKNIEISQGTNLTVEFEKVDTNGNPVNVTGYHAKIQVRKTFEDTEAKFTLTQDEGIEVGTDDGLFTASFLPSHTSPLDAGRYLYDIKIKDTDDNIETLESGYFTVLGSVVKDIS